MKLFDDLFQPSQEDQWTIVAKRFNGELIRHDALSDVSLKFRHRNWSVHVDNYSRMHNGHNLIYTRIRVLVPNASNWKFQVYTETTSSKISKFFGMQDIHIGHKKLDNAFIFKSNQEDQFIELFRSSDLKEVLLKNQRADIWFHDRMYLHGGKCPEGFGQVYIETTGISKAAGGIIDCCELMCSLLDSLKQLNSSFAKKHSFEIG